MALTKDTIVANSVLATLTLEQVAAIETLSHNDETTTIGARIGKLHGDYDVDVLNTSGIPKKSGEHSYEYVKRVISDFKSKVEAFKPIETEVGTLKAEKADLEKKLREGGSDNAIKQKLADTETRLAQIQSTYEADKVTFEAEKAKASDLIKSTHVDYAFGRATDTLKFKSTIPDSVKNVLIRNAKAEILAEAVPDFIESGNEKVLVFRDKNGNLLNNQENKLNPFTAAELITNKLKEVLDFGRKQPGGGTNGEGGSGDCENIDISSAKTQVAADDLIAKHLLSLGLTRTSPDFAKKQAEIRKEYKVDKLPMR